jgi:UDP-N-acetylmuramoyl-L-alanyl-D-glutamate--2,6-diaminopimelate ligase
VDQEVDRILSELRRSSVTPRELAADSRALARGDLFLAYPGEHTDGRRFIADAIARGAGAVLWERDGFAWPDGLAAPNLAVDGLKRLAGPLAAEIYGRPSEQLWVCGVTGTNGKTSCTQWIAQALGDAGRRTAVIGTLGMGLPGRLEATENTTPDAVVLQRALARFHRDGAQGVVMEASSIGIDQGRIEGVRFACALFTNLSRDHLDYHGDMERYAQSKMALFAAPALAHAVINLDDALGVRIAAALAGSGVERIGYSASPGVAAASGLEHWLEAHDVDPYGVDPYGVDPHGVGSRAIDPAGAGLRFRLESSRGGAPVATSLVGRFNVANVLGVIGVLLAAGLGLEEAALAAARLEPPPGRMQRLGGVGQPLVVVDYAHTPDALDQALGALRELARARGGSLVGVFGCGGDRDRGKRPLMGEAASRHADRLWLTSDNPRGESPPAIIDQIRPGVSVPHAVRVDRREAIRDAIDAASAGDVVLIAGKGHEPYQEIAGRRVPFSDAQEARDALAGWAG